MRKTHDYNSIDWHEYFAYDPDTGNLYWRVKRKRASPGDLVKLDAKGYRRVTLFNSTYKVHRIIWVMVYGSIEKHQIIDHIDRNRDNNRIDNLRVVDEFESVRNRSKLKNNSSGVTGVSFHKNNGTWESRISVNGCRICLGSFSNKQDAIAARKAAELKYFDPITSG